jgi:hypothetical protein
MIRDQAKWIVFLVAVAGRVAQVLQRNNLANLVAMDNGGTVIL